MVTQSSKECVTPIKHTPMKSDGQTDRLTEDRNVTMIRGIACVNYKCRQLLLVGSSLVFLQQKYFLREPTEAFCDISETKINKTKC